MPTTLVSLVSEQTFINIIFIKEMLQADRYLFITTDAMERKGMTDSIIRVCQLNFEQTDRKTVKSDSLVHIEERLNELNLAKLDQHYIVNLTGGNKLMSIAVYEHFRNLRADMYYKPIEHNGYLQCFPHGIGAIVPFRTCLTLTEFLNGYGINIKNPMHIHAPLLPVEFTRSVFDNQLLEIEEIRCLIKYKQNYERDQNRNLTSLDLNNPPLDVPGIAGFLKTTLHFPLADPNRLNEREIFYLVGGWFEEYIYQIVKEKYGLTDDYIGLNVFVEKNGVTNELDIVFVKDNDLHIIECKLSLNKKIFEDALYKLVTVQRGTAYSLTSKAYIATSKSYRDRFGEFPKLSKDRAALNYIKIIDPLNINEI